MQQIEWPDNLKSTCADENFHILTEMILNDSKKLFFDNIEKKEKQKPYTNATLAKRALLKQFKWFSIDKRSESLLKIDHNDYDFNLEIRKIITMSYNPKNLNFEYLFKTYGLNLNNYSEKITRISKWISCSMEYFVETWFALFNFMKESAKERIIKTNLILSWLAFNKVDLDFILAMQQIALNFKDFFIFDPPLVKYDFGKGTKYDTDLIKKILRESYKSNSYVYNQSRYYEKKSEEINDTEKALSAFKESLTVSNTISLSDNFENYAIKNIKQLFESWYNNREFFKFIRIVQEKIESLPKSNELNIEIISTNNSIIERTPTFITFDLNSDKNGFQNFKLFSKETPTSSTPYIECSINKNIINDLQNFDFNLNNDLERNYYEHLKESWLFNQNNYNNSPTFDPNFDEIYSKKKELDKLIDEHQMHLFESFSPKSSLISKSLDYAEIWPKNKNFSMVLRYLIFPIEENILIDAKEFKYLVIALGELVSLRNRLIRCIKYAKEGELKINELRREIESEPFKNWSPKENPEWLLLELDMNITIRESQVNIL